MHTVYELVYLAGQRAPNRLAIIDDVTDRKLTYRELLNTIDDLAAGFSAKGITPGDVVATCLPNLYEHSLSLLALNRLGAIPALINARLKPEDVALLVEQGNMNGAIVMADENIVAKVSEKLPGGAPILTVGTAVTGSTSFLECYGDGLRLESFRRPDIEDTAFIFYTSGTTGLPKGVELSHRTTDARMLYMSMQCGLVHGRHNKVIGLMPLFHVVGFYSVFLGALGLDGTYYVCSAFDTELVVETIPEEKISLVYGTPTHFHALLAAPNFSPEKMSLVSNVVYAGAAMPGPLLERVGDNFNAKIVNIYGTTEIMNALYMPDPVGKPYTYRPGFYSNVKVGVFGASVHDEAAVNQDGELLVDASADATFTRYLYRADITAEKLIDGWYRTGDIARKREDGDFDVKGRVDDMIISGGENIYPEEVEAILIKHEKILECSIVGFADEQWGEIVVACIIGSGDNSNESEFDEYLKLSNLANYKRPRRYIFMDELPKNATGKVLRRMLRQQVMG